MIASEALIISDEKEANIFAALLLMPESMLIKEPLLDVEFIDYENSKLIKQLAAKYQVSEQVVIFRLRLSGMLSNI